MTQDRSTPLESVVEEIRRRHRPFEDGSGCIGCDTWDKNVPAWPCDASRLADRVEELEAALGLIKRDTDEVSEGAADMAYVLGEIGGIAGAALSTQPHQDKTP